MNIEYPYCKHRINSKCNIISQVCGLEVIPDVSACQYCTYKSTSPQSINDVTVSLSIVNSEKDKKIEIREKYGQHIQKSSILANNDIRLRNILEGNGVGSQLWKLLEQLGIEHNSSCSCLEWAERLNAWGPSVCRLAKEKIVEHMKSSAKNYGWGDIFNAASRAVLLGLAFRLSIIDPFGSLLEEAIRRAEAYKSEPIDIFIPLVKSNYQDIEIKMALRSIEKYAQNYRKVIVVGYIPDFLLGSQQLELHPIKEFKTNKASRIGLKIKWAFENLDITPNICFWNDDYLLLNKIEITNIKPCYSGSLIRKSNSGYQRILNNTHNELMRYGLNVRHYDIHMPIIYNREKFLSLENWWEKGKNDKIGYVIKSVYGNHYCVNTNYTMRDVKLGNTWSKYIEQLKKKRWLISYSDASLKSGFGNWMNEFLSEKSKFEK